MLENVIPAQWRKFVYAIYALAATIIGALNVGGANTGKAVDVLAYLGIAVGAVAAGNTNPPKTRNDDGLTIIEVCIVVTLVGVILLLCGKSFA